MNKRKIIERWIERNGAADFDLKNKNIILYGDGLFSIEKEKYLSHKIVGRKKLPNGCVEILFSKKKCVPAERYKAYIWFSELDETINYLRRMKKMLNKLGYRTSYRIKERGIKRNPSTSPS